MKNVETALAKVMWVIRAIYIWLKHKVTVEIPSPNIKIQLEYSLQKCRAVMMWRGVSEWWQQFTNTWRVECMERERERSSWY